MQLRHHREQIQGLQTSAAHPVIVKFQSLDARRQQEVACAMSILWDEFVSEMGGPAGWVSRSRNEQTQYIYSLGLASNRILLNGGPDKEHYALAPQLMGLYAHFLRLAEPSPQDRETAAAAVALAARGGLIRKGSIEPREPTTGMLDVADAAA